MRPGVVKKRWAGESERCILKLDVVFVADLLSGSVRPAISLLAGSRGGEKRRDCNFFGGGRGGLGARFLDKLSRY